MPIRAAATFGDAGQTVRLRAKAPKSATKFRVERRTSGRWVYADTVGRIDSVKTKGDRKVVKATAVLAFGAAKYRISGLAGGTRVASETVRLSGYKWVPLTDAFDGFSGGNVAVAGTGLPFMSVFQGGFYGDESEQFTSDSVSCRQAEVGLVLTPGITAGSAKFQFISDKGQLAEFAVNADQGQGLTSLVLDGTPSTLNLLVSITEYDSLDDEVTFAGRAWCNGTSA